MDKKEQLGVITGLWNVELKELHPEIPISGSPERTEFRIVVEDTHGEFFIVERINRRTLENKIRIAQAMAFLRQKGMAQVYPYLPTAQGEYLVKDDGDFWQMSPYVFGVALVREDYVFEGWRGKALADFLIELKQKSFGIPHFSPAETFSITKYIYELLEKIKRHEPQLLDPLTPVVRFLEQEFMAQHDAFPVSFCHGDYHPLNVIWAKEGMNAVIDWEFLGSKPEIYDAANMIGCLGMEDPASLWDELVGNFIAELKRVHIFEDISWKYLLEFVLALRFAWLSEWLRKDDVEMINLELVYMNLLIDNRDALEQMWRQKRD